MSRAATDARLDARPVGSFDDVIARLSGASAGEGGAAPSMFSPTPSSSAPPASSSPASSSSEAGAPARPSIRAQLEETLDEINLHLRRGGLSASARTQFIQKRVTTLAALERLTRDAPIEDHPAFDALCDRVVGAVVAVCVRRFGHGLSLGIESEIADEIESRAVADELRAAR